MTTPPFTLALEALKTLELRRFSLKPERTREVLTAANEVCQGRAMPGSPPYELLLTFTQEK